MESYHLDSQRALSTLSCCELNTTRRKLLESPIEWDLAIFDEAHHLRNTDTLSYGVASFVCERSRAAVFLTATPLQTHLRDLVHLMSALGVDVAEDPQMLEEQMRWDMRLNDWIRLIKRRPPDWAQDAARLLDELDEHGGRERPGWGGMRRFGAGIRSRGPSGTSARC